MDGYLGGGVFILGISLGEGMGMGIEIEMEMERGWGTHRYSISLIKQVLVIRYDEVSQ